MPVRYKFSTGHLCNVMSALRKALGQYARHNGSIKVGLTVNPEQRWEAHRRDGWREMVVIYETRSSRYVGDAEKKLIGHSFLRHNKRCWNIYNGGGGLREGFPKYYIYVILE